MIAASENAAAFGNDLSMAQLSGVNFFNVGQQLHLASMGLGFVDHANSVIRPTNTIISDRRTTTTAAAAAEANRCLRQTTFERESISRCDDDDEDVVERGYKNNSVDEMDDDDDDLSVVGEEKFSSFRQLAAMNGKMANKICRVCGDRALGYNFNVVSCESCKAFFRRNAMKKKEFRCPFNDSCDVTALSRRFCQKCRLRKCFEVGMKKEWIMSEEQRLQKRKRIEENRKKRRSVVDPGENSIRDDQQGNALKDESPPLAKNCRGDQQQQQQNFTNAGFSPNSNPLTPMGTGYGSDYSPPDSNDPNKHHVDGHTHSGRPSTNVGVIGGSPNSNLISAGNLSSDGRPAAVVEKFSLDICRDGSAIDADISAQTILRTFKSETLQFSPNLTEIKRAPFIAAVNDQHFGAFGIVPPNQLLTPLDAAAAAVTMGFCGGATPSTTFGQFPSLDQRSSVIQQLPLDIDQSSTITIPKSVLINLINQCHSRQREFFDQPKIDLSTPVVARAHRLMTMNGTASEGELYKCICRCTCGAKTIGSCIGPRTVDKGVGPGDDDDNGHDSTGERKSPSTVDVPFENSSVDCGQATKKSEMETVIFEPIRRSASMEKTYRNGLTMLEELKLRELIMANRVMEEEPDFSEDNTNSEKMETASSSASPPVFGRSNEEPKPCMEPPDVVHMTDVCVRRIIKMSKRLSAFKSLCQEDQIALLKGGCTELMILRGVMTFIPSKECWRPVGWKNSLLSLDVLKGVKGNVYEEHKKYLHSFRDEWRTCDAIMLCLGAITLFNPDRPNIIHVDAVKMEQELYIDLLKRYLDIMYGVDTMARDEAFQELLKRAQAVGRLNDYAATIFVDVNPRDVEPLLIEIFDLK